jgi:hypothetical protein
MATNAIVGRRGVGFFRGAWLNVSKQFRKIHNYAILRRPPADADADFSWGWPSESIDDRDKVIVAMGYDTGTSSRP